MSIAIKPTKASRVRHLAEQHGYLTPHDIAKLTGYPLAEVKVALQRKFTDRPRTRRWA